MLVTPETNNGVETAVLIRLAYIAEIIMGETNGLDEYEDDKMVIYIQRKPTDGESDKVAEDLKADRAGIVGEKTLKKKPGTRSLEAQGPGPRGHTRTHIPTYGGLCPANRSEFLLVTAAPRNR